MQAYIGAWRGSCSAPLRPHLSSAEMPGERGPSFHPQRTSAPCRYVGPAVRMPHDEIRCENDAPAGFPGGPTSAALKCRPCVTGPQSRQSGSERKRGPWPLRPVSSTTCSAAGDGLARALPWLRTGRCCMDHHSVLKTPLNQRGPKAPKGRYDHSQGAIAPSASEST
jgi:hypothetical protein